MATFAVIEVPARFGDVAFNVMGLDVALAKVRADVVLLPEACLTGYVSPSGSFDLARFGEPLYGPTCAAIAQRAHEHGIHLGAPLIERDKNGRHYNAYVVFGPDGKLIARYRKRHPWFPEVWASPGDEPHPVFDVCGLRATIAICYDVHFLEAEAADVLGEIDVLCFPSAWVEAAEGDDTRAEIFERIARRFRISIANPNWAAGDVRLPGQGSSRIVGPDGRAFPWLTAELGRKH